MNMDEDLNKEIAKMIGPLPRRRRGRPRTGDAKAWKYTQQYEKLVWAGMKPWQAVQEVAKQYRKTPEHISACRKKVYEDYLSYIADDLFDSWRENMLLERGPDNADC
jgi:hypothetical protein